MSFFQYCILSHLKDEVDICVCILCRPNMKGKRKFKRSQRSQKYFLESHRPQTRSLLGGSGRQGVGGCFEMLLNLGRVLTAPL